MSITIEKQIANWLEGKLGEEGLFLVDTEIKPSGEINVYVDGMKNVSISQCATISRFLEKFLDESDLVSANYNLQVSSPGMENPLRVPQQYLKRIGQKLEVKTSDQKTMVGWLTSANDEKIALFPQELHKSGSTKNKALKNLAPDLNKIDKNSIVEISLSSIDKAMLKIEF